MRIAVAMSGGVDSSVAAHILKGAGHEVLGLTMKLWPCDADLASEGRTCCDPDSIRDAERVAGELGIRHYTVAMRGAFERAVIRDFVLEYSRGRTPNPCVRCNRYIKFDAFLTKAEALGATHLATGHHAAVMHNAATGLHELRRGRDREKDQSYFLYSLSQAQLSRVVMPVGTLTKAEVRQLAADAGLHIAERAESQDLCFVAGGDVASFFRLMSPGAMQPGPIEDRTGHVLGRHAGIALYTVGQRSGLGISRPRPTYVISIDAERNTLVVGNEEDLHTSSLRATGVTWVSGTAPSAAFRAHAKIRYASEPAPCAVTVEADRVGVQFDELQRAVAPGQSVVFYDGDLVLGGGTIEG